MMSANSNARVLSPDEITNVSQVRVCLFVDLGAAPTPTTCGAMVMSATSNIANSLERTSLATSRILVRSSDNDESLEEGHASLTVSDNVGEFKCQSCVLRSQPCRTSVVSWLASYEPPRSNFRARGWTRPEPSRSRAAEASDAGPVVHRRAGALAHLTRSALPSEQPHRFTSPFASSLSSAAFASATCTRHSAEPR